MTRINHFQIYSGRENHVTNNTMLMMRHVYRVSPLLVARLLTSLLDTEVSVGLEFAQQERGLESIPDAAITQAPMFIYFEAKHGGGGLYDDQMQRHLRSIAGRKHPAGSAFLIGLTRDEPPLADRERFSAMGKADEIQSASKTYGDLIEALRAICADHPLLSEIFEDYEAFIAGEGLLVDRDRWMVAFPCGTSWKENAQHGVYYEPASRNPKWESAFLGLYHNKQISHVGRIVAAAICSYEGSVLSVENPEFGTLDQAQKDRIIDIIGSATYYGNFAADPYRMYVVDRFEETDLRKVSAGGMLGHRYLDITRLAPNVGSVRGLSTSILAARLKTRTFE